MARVDRASRVVAAPLAEVYAALVDPLALAAWVPPDGMSGRFERFDLRPGGGYRMVLTYETAADAAKTTADTDVVEARFVAIDPERRVVHAIDFVSDDPQYAGTMTMTWDVRSVPAGTLVDVTAEDVPEGISVEDHQVGLASSLANLAAHLE